VAGESYEHASRCLTKSLAQDLVSTRALYALLGASSQTRTLLPPVFRDLWTAWANEDEQARVGGAAAIRWAALLTSARWQLALIERDRGARVEFVRRVLASRAQSTAVAAAAGEQTAADAKQEARGRRAQGAVAGAALWRGRLKLTCCCLQAFLRAWTCRPCWMRAKGGGSWPRTCPSGRYVCGPAMLLVSQRRQVRDDIISALEESDFLVVVGETGCVLGGSAISSFLR
jgi:hypothetical protein